MTKSEGKSKKSVRGIFRFFNDNWKNWFIFFVSLVVCLFFIEAFLRQGFLLKESGPGMYSGMWEELWLSKHKVQVNNGSIGGFSIDKFDPVLGWTLFENLRNESFSSRTIVSSNSQGIRGTKEYTFEKQNKTRILAIGDSYTFGECVKDNETFPAYLESMYNNSEVINMGVHAYGTDQMLLKLKTYGIKYSPDIIIVSVISESIRRDMLSFRDYEKPKFTLKNGELYLENVPITPPEKYKRTMFSSTINHIRMLIDALNTKRNEEENKKISEKIFEEMIKQSKQVNATIIFVALSDIYRDSKLGSNQWFYSTYSNLEDNKSVYFVNPYDRINNFLKGKESPEKYFECHYKPEIQKLVAEEIYSFLKNKANTTKN